MDLIAILQAALPVVIALALGMLCRKTGFLTREAVDALKKLVINITLPAVLLSAFATAEYSASTLALPVLMFGLCCAALALGFLVIRVSKMRSRLTPFLAAGAEAGMLGYVLFGLLFPDKGASEFAILDIGQTLFVFTLFKILISGKKDLRTIGKDMLTTPILWAVAAGVLIGATGLYGAMVRTGISNVFDGVTSFVSAPTGMVILLTVGYDLVPKEIPWRKTAGLLAMRLGIMAVIFVLGVLVNRTLLQCRVFEGALLLMCILPPPYVIPVFADEPEERVQISASLSTMTLTTMILFGALSVWLGIQ